MEIRTCEEYVLAQLRDAQEQAESLRLQLEDVQRELAYVQSISPKDGLNPHRVLEAIAKHKRTVLEGSSVSKAFREGYALSHDHISDLIEQLAKESMTNG